MNIPAIILVTGTDTGVGKTITTAALAVTLRGRGRSVAVYKPCQSGNNAGDSDITEVRRLAGEVCAEAGVVLQEPLAPVAAAALEQAGLPPISAHAEQIHRLAEKHHHVVVEGAGGLLVDLDSDGGTLAGLGALLTPDAGFVVVVRPGLGTLNHTALTLEALERRALTVTGLVLGSWPPEPGLAELSNREVLDSLAVPLLGAIPAAASELPPKTFQGQAAAWLLGMQA